jgi:transcriptional regulator with GAF, ATPase, and Fis domain/tetratricopeptide (TPR) repeat protein
MNREATDISISSRKDRDHLMGVAAIFEEDFSIDWLEELTELKTSLILVVVEGEAENGVLIKKAPAIYAFANDGQRTACLSVLSSDEIERYHRLMAVILVKELPDTDEKAIRVARHLRHVSNDIEGCRWLLRAGEIYADSSSAMAIDCFEKVIGDLQGKQGEAEDGLFARAILDYTNTSWLSESTTKTLSLLHEAKTRARRLRGESLEPLIEMHIAKQEWMASHDEKALRRFERAYSATEKTDDPALSAARTDLKNYFLFWQGRFPDVIETYERTLPDVESYRSGTFPISAAITVARAYAMTGQFAQGIGMLHTIYDRCVGKRDLFLAAHAGSAIGILMLGINRLDDAFRYLRSSFRQARQSQNHYVTLLVTFMFALAHYRRGENRQSVRYLRQFLKDSRESHVSHQLYPYLVEICWAAETGAFPRVSGLSLDHEIQEMLGISNLLIRGIAYRYEALLGNRRCWPNRRIMRSFGLSAKLLEESGHRIEYARTQMELARYHLGMSETKKARRLLRNVSEILPPGNTDLIPDDLRAFISVSNREGIVLDAILGLSAEMMQVGSERCQFLQQVVMTINRLVGAERGAVFLADPDVPSAGLLLRSSKNLTTEQVDHPDFAEPRRMIEEVVHSGKGRLFEVKPPEETLTRPAETVRSAICVPFFLDGRPSGVLYHDNRILGNVFSESDLRLLNYFSALVALEIGRDRAHREARDLADRNRSGSIAVEPGRGTSGDQNGIVGASRAVRQMQEKIARIAETDTTVLVLGETGVGKNLVAKAIHQISRRSGGAFVSVQCSALTESLITSELFGHEKGAFTGATNRHIGRFELADKGTLFLDEIGDLSQDVQARLLRVLQSKEFERVGGGKETLTSDFRLIAATNRNLEEDVIANRFRRDLYYRVNVFPLFVPPLRERREDIPLLVRHFLKVHAAATRHVIKEIPRDVMEKLADYDWPGNIRELENTIERGLILGGGRRFVLPELGGIENTAGPVSRNQTLADNEKSHIMEVLKLTGWRIYGPRGAAKVLAVKPTTLASRMKKLGIRRPPV